MEVRCRFEEVQLEEVRLQERQPQEIQREMEPETLLLRATFGD